MPCPVALKRQTARPKVTPNKEASKQESKQARQPKPNGRRERDGPDRSLYKPWASKQSHSSGSCVSPPRQGLWDGGMAEGQRGFPDPDTGSVLQPGPRAPPRQSSSSTADRMDPSGPVTLTAPGGGQTARQGPQRTSGC